MTTIKTKCGADLTVVRSEEDVSEWLIKEQPHFQHRPTEFPCLARREFDAMELDHAEYFYRDDIERMLAALVEVSE